MKEQDRVRQRHWHRSLELTYHENANGAVYIDGKKHVLKGNMLTLINSRCVHEIHNHVTDQSTSTVLVIPYDLLKEEIPDFDNMYFSVDEQDAEIIRIMTEMYETLESGRPYHSLHLISLQYELLYYLCSHCCSHRRGIPTLSVYSANDWAQEVSKYLSDNYTSIQGIQEISAYFGYSREAFCRKFKQIFHCTVRQFLTKLRLKHAIDQLRQTDHRYSKVAADCGFSTLRNLRKNMIDFTGHSLEEIRAMPEEECFLMAEKMFRGHLAKWKTE